MQLGPETHAIVIGGGSGIGRGTALGLASKGAKVVVADIEVDSAERVAAELRAGGTESLACRVDATDESDLATLADRAFEVFGDIHVLSNNVGVIVDSPLLDSTEDQWAWAIEFNLFTLVRCCRVIVPHIRAHGRGGHVVNTASMAALMAATPEQVAGVNLGIYTATKHAALGFTETLRGELAADGIGVSCLCPGTVDSNLMATSMRNRPDRYGGPVDTENYSGSMPNVMSQEEVGKYVVAAIEGDRIHVLTHPHERGLIERRHRALMDDFDFFAAVEG